MSLAQFIFLFLSLCGGVVIIIGVKKERPRIILTGTIIFGLAMLGYGLSPREAHAMSRVTPSALTDDTCQRETIEIKSSHCPSQNQQDHKRRVFLLTSSIILFPCLIFISIGATQRKWQWVIAGAGVATGSLLYLVILFL